MDKKFSTQTALFAILISLCCIAWVSWYPEGNKPTSGDTQIKSLQKINDLLYQSGSLSNSFTHIGANFFGESLTYPLFSQDVVAELYSVANSNMVKSLTNQLNFKPIISAMTFTIPDAVGYVSGQVINGGSSVAVPPLTLTNVLDQAGGGGFIRKVRIATDTNVWNIPIRLWFYTSTNVTWFSNHAVFTLMFTNAAARRGYVDMPSMFTEAATGNSAISQNVDSGLPFSLDLDPADTKLYVYPEAKGSITNYPGQSFRIEVVTEPRRDH